MNASEIRRIGEVIVQPVPEKCAEITNLIQMHGWSLHELGIETRPDHVGAPYVTATLVHADQGAEPSDFGYLVENPQTQPTS